MRLALLPAVATSALYTGTPSFRIYISAPKIVHTASYRSFPSDIIRFSQLLSIFHGRIVSTGNWNALYVLLHFSPCVKPPRSFVMRLPNHLDCSTEIFCRTFFTAPWYKLKRQKVLPSIQTAGLLKGLAGFQRAPNQTGENLDNYVRSRKVRGASR